MKSIPKDVEIIQLDSSREMSKDNPPSTRESQQLATPQLNIVEMASTDIPPQSNEGKVPLLEPLVNTETPHQSSQDEALSFELKPPISPNRDSTDSPKPFTPSPLTQGGVESSVPPLSSIPSTDLDLISFFNEDDEVDNIFDVLENWTTGPSVLEKIPEPVFESTTTFQPLLESFRLKAYVDDLNPAFIIPEFKIEVEQMVDDLLAYPDLPPAIHLELQEFIKPFTLT
ncbi:uncharacterized protein LOC114916002 [Cajanus cajan]|uniref:uncharacterized protein LOC114916002 n=1 Tax=Cajanus cajan TaxID=3821 RepID=UPI0010FB3548|nr:uncharacterized protein LOC114916002 [Cajanus cajan]